MLVNLDPANEFIPYKPDIDINDLITLDDAMREEGLGPNGAMIFCLEFLEKNLEWLVKEMKKFPGAAQPRRSLPVRWLFRDRLSGPSGALHPQLCREEHLRLPSEARLSSKPPRKPLLTAKLVAVHLVDSHYCTDLVKFVSVLLVSLKTMVMLELPHVNVLSKVDLMESYGQLGRRPPVC